MNVTVTTEGMEYRAITAEGSELRILYGEEKPEDDTSMNPLEIFLSSLGMCIMVMLRKYFAAHDMGDPEIDIQISGDFTPGDEACSNVAVKVEIEGDWDDRRKAAFLKIAETCPVHGTVTHGDGISIEIV